MGRLCAACGSTSPDRALECLFCGRQTLLPRDPTHRTQRETKAHAIGEAAETVLLRADVPLLACCGGQIPVASVVIVTGEAGAGKSTEAARLALALNRRTAWLDAEQNAERTRDVWRRAGAQEAALRSGKFKRVPATEGEWSAAVREANRARVVVVDSLDEWTFYVREGGGELARRAVLKQAQAWASGGRVVLVVCHYARAGHLKGSTTADHGGDGTIHVEKDRIWQRKCRWAPPGEVRRESYAAAAGAPPDAAAAAASRARARRSSYSA